MRCFFLHQNSRVVKPTSDLVTSHIRVSAIRVFFVAAVLCQFGPIQFCVIDMEAFLTTKLGELQGVQDKITRLEKELSEARQLQMFLEIEVAKIRAGIVVVNPEVPKT